MAEPQTLRDRLPPVFPRDQGDDFTEWLRAHSDELARFNSDLDQIQKSLRISEATGQSLDLIGREYGLLGRRRGRSDSAYRQFLQSLVQAFDGRGTNEGLKIAIAAGIVISPDDVEIHNDFTELEYEVELHEWTPHSSTTVRDVAELADASCTDQRDPVRYQVDEGKLALAGEDTKNSTVTGTLSSSTLGNLSSGDWDLSQ